MDREFWRVLMIKPPLAAVETVQVNLNCYMKELCHRILRFALKTKRKKQLSTYDKLLAAEELEMCQPYPLA